MNQSKQIKRETIEGKNFGQLGAMSRWSSTESGHHLLLLLPLQKMVASMAILDKSESC
jgi:hypothetical protein